MFGHPFAIGPVGLFEATVVSNVLTLGHAAVDVQSDVVQLVSRVLIDDALSPLPEGLDRCVIPPLLQVAVLVELSSFVVETVSDFVTNHDSDPAVLENKSHQLFISISLRPPTF